MPLLARRDGCPVYGGESMGRLLVAHGPGDRAMAVEPHRAYEIGPLRLRFVPSGHSKLVLGLAVPQEGEITCEHCESMTASDYRCGQVWGVHIEVAGTSLHHLGSCDLIETELKLRAERFLAGIEGRGSTPRLCGRALPRLRPAHIVPHHFDDSFPPVDRPLGFSFNVNFGAALHEIRAVDPSIDVVSLAALEWAPT